MKTMSAVEFDLMDELYFITPFKDLLSAISRPEPITKKTMCSLIQKEFVWQFYFDEAVNDFVRTDPPDLLELQKYYYLASKKGLLAHNT